MNDLFKHATSFNQNINNWNIGSVREARLMFCGAKKFNQPIGDWKWSKNMRVYSMVGTFMGAEEFNQPIGKWRFLTEHCPNTHFMFANAKKFNQNINDWSFKPTSAVMMFAGAKEFNQPLDKWDFSKEKNFDAFFMNAIKFNQPIGGWNASNGVSFNHMFNCTGNNFIDFLLTLNYLISKQITYNNNNATTIKIGQMEHTVTLEHVNC